MQYLNWGFNVSRREKRREAKLKLAKINDSRETVLIIHYSCESFYDKTDGKSPRITSIAIRYMSSGQTMSYSNHQIAERKNVQISQIEERYDEFEKEMLDDNFDFVRSHSGYK